jgi:hypothetical protein
MEFMRFLPKGLNPFKIQKRFKLEFAFEIYNSKSREIWKLPRKESLFYLKFSITMPSLENFEQKEDHIVHF